MFESEDLSVFTSGEFSTVAIVDSATYPFAELSGIFDENYQDMFGGFDAPTTEGRKFCFQIQTDFRDGLKRGDRLTIYGKNYSIISMQPKYDGRLTNIVLRQDFA